MPEHILVSFFLNYIPHKNEKSFELPKYGVKTFNSGKKNFEE